MDVRAEYKQMVREISLSATGRPVAKYFRQEGGKRVGPPVLIALLREDGDLKVLREPDERANGFLSPWSAEVEGWPGNRYTKCLADLREYARKNGLKAGSLSCGCGDHCDESPDVRAGLVSLSEVCPRPVRQ